jgi:hypothetical protein
MTGKISNDKSCIYRCGCLNARTRSACIVRTIRPNTGVPDNARKVGFHPGEESKKIWREILKMAPWLNLTRRY